MFMRMVTEEDLQKLVNVVFDKEIREGSLDERNISISTTRNHVYDEDKRYFTLEDKTFVLTDFTISVNGDQETYKNVWLKLLFEKFGRAYKKEYLAYRGKQIQSEIDSLHRQRTEIGDELERL